MKLQKDTVVELQTPLSTYVKFVTNIKNQKYGKVIETNGVSELPFMQDEEDNYGLETILFGMS